MEEPKQLNFTEYLQNSTLDIFIGININTITKGQFFPLRSVLRI